MTAGTGVSSATPQISDGSAPAAVLIAGTERYWSVVRTGAPSGPTVGSVVEPARTVVGADGYAPFVQLTPRVSCRPATGATRVWWRRWACSSSPSPPPLPAATTAGDALLDATGDLSADQAVPAGVRLGLTVGLAVVVALAVAVALRGRRWRCPAWATWRGVGGGSRGGSSGCAAGGRRTVHGGTSPSTTAPPTASGRGSLRRAAPSRAPPSPPG
jgi:hypothetical protein